MNALVIGGTSGLGLALAKEFADGGNKVIIAGRHDPKLDFAEFRQLDLSSKQMPAKIEVFVKALPQINYFIHSAGYYQKGRVTDLSAAEIEEMINVCGRSLVYFCKYLLEKQGKLDELITITSTSQWTPRKDEPVYNFAKAAAGQFSNGLAEDGRVTKVLVAGPAGMKTGFWDGVKRDDLNTMLDKGWVAKKIMQARKGKYYYKFIKILRQPARVEVAETR